MDSSDIVALVAASIAIVVSIIALVREAGRDRRGDSAQTLGELEAAWSSFRYAAYRDAAALDQFDSRLEIAEILSPTDVRLLRYKGYRANQRGNVELEREYYQRAVAVLTKRKSHRRVVGDSRALLDLARVSSGEERLRLTRSAQDDPSLRAEALAAECAYWLDSWHDHELEPAEKLEAWDKARSAIDEAVRTEPKNSSVRLQKAALHGCRSQREEQGAELEMAVNFASNAELSNALLQYGDYFFWNRDEENHSLRAETCLRLAASCAPDGDSNPILRLVALNLDRVAGTGTEGELKKWAVDLIGDIDALLERNPRGVAWTWMGETDEQDAWLERADYLIEIRDTMEAFLGGARLERGTGGTALIAKT